MQLGRFATAVFAAAVLVIAGTLGVARAEAPEHLDRAGIESGLTKARPKVLKCGEKSPGVKGRVQVKVTVAPDGKVSSVAILETPDPALGSCIADVMKSTRFGDSKNGGSLIYPFMF